LPARCGGCPAPGQHVRRPGSPAPRAGRHPGASWWVPCRPAGACRA